MDEHAIGNDPMEVHIEVERAAEACTKVIAPVRDASAPARRRPVPKLERDDYERSREVGTERVKALQGRVAAVDGRS